LLSDDEYAGLQWHLALYPKCGDVIQGTGGRRKVRWTDSGRGKRGAHGHLVEGTRGLTRSCG
jgi:hypothetical protein